MTFVSPTKIDPSIIIQPVSNTGKMISGAEEIAKVLADAQAFRDLESVIINMPQSSTITPASVLALIESHRTTNKEYYSKGLDSGSLNSRKTNPIYIALQEQQQILLDANKAIKKAKYLEDEVERLRKRLEDKK